MQQIKRDIVRKRKEEKRELKQFERIQNRENLVEEDINLGRLFEFATTNKKYVNSLVLHEIENEF